MAEKSRFVVNGVKGFSWLSILQHHDIVRETAIDYMHDVLLGVQKLLLSLWFGNTHSKEEFSLYHLVSVVDQRLKNISPTLDITRLPRSISEHLKYWKANELRSFLLYYGLPVLYGLLPDKYFEHYFCFVRAIYLPLQDTISEAQLATEEPLLQQFCCTFSNLYQERYETLNVHQLLHLVDKSLNELEFKALEMLPTTAEVNAFNRVELNNSLIYGLDYKRMFKRSVCYGFNKKNHIKALNERQFDRGKGAFHVRGSEF